MKYIIQTKIIDNDTIEQKVLLDNENNLGVNRIIQEILDTREAQTREALIQLGWTPPDED